MEKLQGVKVSLVVLSTFLMITMSIYVEGMEHKLTDKSSQPNVNIQLADKEDLHKVIITFPMAYTLFLYHK